MSSSTLASAHVSVTPRAMDPRAFKIRQNIIDISHKSGHGHIPTSFSIIESLCAIYNQMTHNPEKPDDPDRDVFILSKGHASLGFYCVLAEYGYFPIEDVYGFGAHDQKFGCHPDRLKVEGAEASTGSLGHGISLAAGMALGMKIKGEDRQAFTLIGDGESNEGTVWETLMVAAHNELKNLTVIFDANNSQIRCMPISSPAAKFKAFGCNTIEVDGHDVNALEEAIKAPSDQVKVVVAHTVKGYGCKSFTEGDGMFAWHRRSPSAEEQAMLLEELNEHAR
ncbi:MAG: transketolase [Chloroflexota bacterium]